MTTQEDFDQFVNNHNEDYLLLLTRASRRHYDCLISSFVVLSDLHKVIQVLYDSGAYTYKVLPYPLSIRGEDVLLRQLGFGDAEIRNIFGFLDFVQSSQGMNFESCIEAGAVSMCARIKTISP